MGLFGGGVLVFELNDLDTTLLSIVSPDGGDRPVLVYEMKSNGQATKGEGDTGSAVTLVQMGNDYLISGNASDLEVEYVETSTSGAAGTLVGTLGSFNALSGNRTINWSKDTNSVGTAVWNGTIEIREIATPANTTGALAVTMTGEVSA